MLQPEPKDTQAVTTMKTQYVWLTIGQSANYTARHMGGH
jgi:hypothetical protein